MSAGEGSLEAYGSYLAIGRETTFKTYNTASASLPFLSASLKTVQESKILEQIENSRTYSKRVHMGRIVEGEVEAYAFSESTALAYIMQNAFGGTVTSATATGETAGGAAFEHTFVIGAMDQSYPSLCINQRKGQSSGGMVFEYNGGRIDALNFTSEIDEPLKFNMAVVCVDSTNTSNDVSAALAVDDYEPLNFIGGRVSVENSFASLTSTSFWHVQSAEFGLANSLKKDTASRRIGSAVLDVLPPGIQSYTLNLAMRFDTTTARDAMLNETELAVELEFSASTITTSVLTKSLKFQFPAVYVSDSGEPEIGGPDEMLSANVVCHILRDDSSAGGYALRAILRNDVSSYA